ncbi:MAG: choice-of-anchor B family protein [Planctomycetes bacterium]|nr:choice-of-anchor B family protein [Planctomycetota bacterium]
MRAMSSRLLALAASAAALAPSASAQGDRVHLLSRFNGHDAGGSGGWDYNDVLGYRDPSGREIALLGTWNGTSFVETTDPFNPVELAYITHSGSLWSDMSVWQDHVYVVTDLSAGGGLQIIDVSDLSNIHVVGSYLGFNTAHSLFVDPTAGVLYCCGTDVGMVVLDLANPAAPTLITTYTNQYVHEVTAQNGVLHLSEIFAGTLRVADVSALPAITTLDSLVTPAAFTHSSTVDAADALVGMTDEIRGAKFVLYDVSDPTNILQRSTFLENPDGIFHNVLITDGLVHLSAYAEGYVALDISDPDRPLRIGAYDTFVGASGGYSGAWGIWEQPSGTIYISNIEDGLFVLSRASRILHAPLADTLDATGPYTITATITPSSAGGGITGAFVDYTSDEGATLNSVALAPTGQPGEWSAQLPGQPRGTTVRYALRATDALGTSREPVTADAFHVFSVGERTRHFLESFDGGSDGGFSHGASAGADDWQRGVPARRRQDPYRTPSGTQCFGNDLGNGSDGLHADGSSNWLETPAIDLTSRHGVRLRFARWLRVDDSARDVARVLVNGAEVWRNATNGGTLPTLDVEWGTIDLDISAQADGVAATKVRFELISDASGARGGWNIDDVELYSVSTCRDTESYGNGYAGSGGFVPTLTLVGDPQIGGPPVSLVGADLLGGASGVVLFGFVRAQTPFKTITLWVDLAPPALVLPIVASGSSGVAGAGSFTLTDSIPDDPTIVGIEIDTQVVMFDRGAPGRLAASAGLAFWICQ